MGKQTSKRSFILNKQGLFFKWRWWLFCLLAAGYITFEMFEHPVASNGISYIMVFEILLLVFPLSLSIYLYEVISKAVAEKDQAVHRLDEKNRLILQLAKAQEWDDLVASIVKFPGGYVDVALAWLQVYDDSLKDFSIEAVWTPEDGAQLRPFSFNPREHCSTCCPEFDFAEKGLRSCKGIAQQEDTTGGEGYCLPLFYGARLIALLCFKLPAKINLDKQTEDILNDSSFEISGALETARERRARMNSELSNAARGERLSIARDLHDTLGQNLGFLHLKLDQYTQADYTPNPAQMKPDLERMHLVADEAFELVRDTLAFMHQDDDVRMKLYDLIEIHGKLVANRSNLDFSLISQGDSVMLPLQIVRQVDYAIKEALHNIESHAEARRITITLEWGVRDLSIHIVDDGIGFDPKAVQKNHHFGLEMMRGRIEACKGRFSIESAPGAGAHLIMWLPTICDETLAAHARGQSTSDNQR
jgi:signal transduction histidine kinase